MTENRLFDAARGSPWVPPINRRLNAGDFLRLNSVADAAKPFVVALLSQISNRPVLVVTDGLKSQESFFNDVQAFAPDALFYPAWETLPHEDVLPHADTIADRLRVLSKVVSLSEDATNAGAKSNGLTHDHGREIPRSARNDNWVIVASVQALLQRTFSAAALSALRFPLSVGQTLEPDALLSALIERGYSPEVQVNERGDMAHRGGIVDFFPLERDDPVRAEFAGDQVESVRVFDAASQQSRDKLPGVLVTPAGEVGLLKRTPDKAVSLLELLPSGTLLVLDEPERLAEAAASYARQIPDADPFFEPWEKTLGAKLQQVHLAEAIATESLATPAVSAGPLNLRLVSLEAFRPLEARAPEPEVADRMRREFFDQLRRWIDEGYVLHVLCGTDGERQRFEELWREQFRSFPSSLHARRWPAAAGSTLSRGFLWPDAKLAVVTDAEIFGRYKLVRPRRKFHQMGQPTDWTDLQEGDFVVHIQHGIGKYLGLRTIEANVAAPAADPFEAQPAVIHRQEVLAIEYADEARLYVPVDQAHLVSKYIGAGKRIPQLHQLGGALWQRQKFTAERAIMDLASELLEIQAARQSLEGHAFAPDAPWQREFEAAFPYDETPDQETAIEEVKRDMESRKPMDRLICGDVGYGKTEVAIRAAFKAVMNGFQVAILCPTTVLAEQHWNTCRERMAGFPITIEMLSRFRSPREQKKAVKLLREGGVDIIIGTHRLLSADVTFKNLGLVVIDEEQRFGVLHKERFKQLRKLVDVLTLSATPIPRTLYLALTGARDMSTIETAPQDRLPVETIIAPYDERLIKRAIQRELNRGGQVYFLHNRVQSIDAVAERLSRLFSDDAPRSTLHAPRISIGHGQMSEHQLEDVMHRFVNGQVDVLVCTTIIESGLDIPNANTIIIDRADRFGLSDLYQLRGRVGRWKHQAYAYILLPRHMQLVQSARKRISAIKQYSSLGSGFKIAMRDLEIRGAGNILGAEQSGHITAIGFDLYCQLLKASIARLKGEKPRYLPQVTLKLDFLLACHPQLAPKTSGAGEGLPDKFAATDGGLAADTLARIPSAYITDSRLRIEAYRKIAQLTELADVNALRAEFRDRYGPLPREMKLLLQCAEVRLLAAAAKVNTVETRADRIMLAQRGVLFQVDGKFPRLTSTKPEGKLTEIKKVLESLASTSTKHRDTT
ncbi:MAG TPA: transcription-repair coupling factor [Verrucomicrobiae bacterium]|nr:transcription-repair coupling factor [Verrucomicrobiae bacterium]